MGVHQSINQCLVTVFLWLLTVLCQGNILATHTAIETAALLHVEAGCRLHDFQVVHMHTPF